MDENMYLNSVFLLLNLQLYFVGSRISEIILFRLALGEYVQLNSLEHLKGLRGTLHDLQVHKLEQSGTTCSN